MNDPHSVDWDEVERQFTFLRAGLDPIHLPTDTELRAYKAQRSRGRKTRNGLGLALDWGERMYPGSARRVERVREFNADLRSGGVLKPKSGDHGDRCDLFGQYSRSCFDVIAEAIATKKVSTDFLFAWGYLNSLVGRQLELLEQEEDAADQFDRGIQSGATQDTTLQHYWYARWVYEHSGRQKAKRTEIDFMLSELCADIWQRRRKPSAGFDAGWFEKLIRQEADNPANDKVPVSGPSKLIHLRTSFTRLGWARLIKMADDPAISADLHPPTLISAFPKS